MIPNKPLTTLKGIIAMSSITLLSYILGFNQVKLGKEFVEDSLLLIAGMIFVAMLLIAAKKKAFYCNEESEL